MILTVTLNTSIDKLYLMESIHPETVMRVKEVHNTAGGKGLNVSRVAAKLQEPVTAMGFVGGFNGQYLESLISSPLVRCAFTHVQGETRSCINCWDLSNGRSTEYLEPGQPVTQEDIDRFVAKSDAWIRRHLREQEEKRRREAEHPVERMTREQIEALAQKAVEVIPRRVAYYAPLVGVTYGRITIRNQRSRWGSCSAKGNLNFNCLLCLTPLEVLDSVVVHELCHRLEMNHSKRFYENVLRV